MQQIDINYIQHYNIEYIIDVHFFLIPSNFNIELSPLHHNIFPSIYNILGAETAVP